MRLLFVSLLVLGAFATGFTARRAAAPESSPAPEATKPPTAPIATAESDPASDPERPSLSGDALLELALERYQANDLVGAATNFYEWLDAYDASALARRVPMLMNSDDSESEFQGTVIGVAIHRWADLDSESLESLELELGGKESLAEFRLMAELRRDADAALAGAEGEEKREICIEYIAARHPEFDLDWARSFGVPIQWFVSMWLRRGLDPSELLEGRLDGDTLIAVINHQLAGPNGRDADAMAGLLSRFEDPQLLEQAHRAIQTWVSSSGTSPLKSLQLLEKLGIPYSREGGRFGYPLSSYYVAAISETPKEAIDWLMGLDPEQRKAAVPGIFGTHYQPSTNPAGALALYLRLPPDELPPMLTIHNFLRQIQYSDPLGTLEWLEQVSASKHFSPKDDKHRMTYFLQTADDLGNILAHYQTIDDAVATARNVSDPRVRSAILGGIIEINMLMHLDSSTQLFEKLGDELDSRIRENIVDKLERHTLHRTFRNQGIEVAMAQLHAIEEPGRLQILASSLIHETSVPFAHRAAVIDALPEATSDAFDNANSLITPWARLAPAEAAQWLAGKSSSPHFNENVDGLVREWASRDVNAAAAWLGSLESGPTLDAAAAIIVAEASDVDPHTALEWAASIDDPERRVENLQRAVLAIDTHATENDEARDAIAAASISDGERQLLFHHLALPQP